MKIKNIALIFAAAALATAFSMTASAAGWQLDGQRWKYQNEDGGFNRGGWSWIDSNGDGQAQCYYFDDNGYLITGGKTPDGYDVNADGAWVKDGTVQMQAAEVRTGGTGPAAQAAEAASAGTASSAAGWQLNGPIWRYRNEDGSYLKGGWNWIDADGDGQAQCYYFDDNGYLTTGGVTPDGYVVNANGEWVQDGIVQVQARSAEASEAEIANWFDGAVLVGDSIMEGFQMYSMQHSDTWLGNLQFFARVSYSLYNDVHGAVRPLYQGQKMRMVQALPLMGAKRVFFLFGANDIGTTGIDGTVQYYKRIISELKAVLPDLDVNIISTTYVTAAYSQKGTYLTNPKIQQLNSLLQQACAENGWGYVDLANHLSDGNGNLPSQYAAGDGVHQPNRAYAVWADVLHAYGAERIKAGHN